MTQILSKPVGHFDITAASLRNAARDLGEVLALMAGGVRPDPETLARLHLSLRLLQGFLLDEAVQQEQREEIARFVSADFSGDGTPVFASSPMNAAVAPLAEVS